jgi:hypothetical protein
MPPLTLPEILTHILRCHGELPRESFNGQDLYPDADHPRYLIDNGLPLDRKATVVIADNRLNNEGRRLGGNRIMNTRVARDRHHLAEDEVTISQSDE